MEDTFDGELQLRQFLGAAYYGGEDNRDLSFLEWINPFNRSCASVSFNRLFSSCREYASINENGLTFIGGQDRNDADYVYILTTLEF